MKTLSLILFILFGLSNVSFAKSHRNLLEGGLELESLKIKGENGGSSSSSNFALNINYWHRYKPKLYLVGNLQFVESDLAGDSHLFAGGAAYNWAGNSRGDFEIGPGFRFGLTSINNDDGFLFGPYLFVRNFLSGSRAFITFELGYTFAFLDDVDYRGFISSVALGISF